MTANQSSAIPPTRGNYGLSFHALASEYLAGLVFFIYSNSFQASWHLDDYQNITQNSRVQIHDLNPATLFQTFFASPEGKRYPYRSVSFFTFALNAYLGGTDVFGYHAVNVAVHLLTALFLYLSVLKLLATPKLEPRPHRLSFFIALMTAGLGRPTPYRRRLSPISFSEWPCWRPCLP